MEVLCHDSALTRENSSRPIYIEDWKLDTSPLPHSRARLLVSFSVTRMTPAGLLP